MHSKEDLYIWRRFLLRKFHGILQNKRMDSRGRAPNEPAAFGLEFPASTPSCPTTLWPLLHTVPSCGEYFISLILWKPIIVLPRYVTQKVKKKRRRKRTKKREFTLLSQTSSLLSPSFHSPTPPFSLFSPLSIYILKKYYVFNTKIQ